MDALAPLSLISLKDGIQACFSSVFSEINVAAEAWLQERKLFTVGRDNFTDFVLRRVGIFPLFGTSRSATVDESYVSLELSRDLERMRYRDLSDIEQGIRRQRHGASYEPERQQDGFSPLDALNLTEGGFALVGNPGSGKTTVFRHLVVEAARGRTVQGRRVLPIYLAVRDMSDSEIGIYSAASSLLASLEVGEHQRVLDLLLKEGRCLLLLDGLDETKQEHQRSLLLELGSIAARYPKATLCVSARPLSLEVGLPGFTKWETLPLDFEKRLGFVKKWFSVVNYSKGERLVQRCRQEPALLDLGSSPLMLSIVCALYENDLDIPKEQDELYARCVEGLLGGWDAFRNIARNSLLAPLSLRKRLTYAAWIAAELFEAEKVVFDSADVEKIRVLERVSEFVGVDTLPADLVLASLYNDFGLLTERSPSKYSFSHLSLHEYLTARYIVENRRENELLSTHFRDPRWREVLRIVAKMLPNSDEFLLRVLQLVKLHQLMDVEQLEVILSVRPAASHDVRLRLYRHLAQRISGALHLLASDMVIEENVLTLEPRSPRGWQGAVRKARQEEAFERKRREGSERAHKKKGTNARSTPDSIMLIVNCLEPLVRMLQGSGFELLELRVDSPFMRVWEASGWSAIHAVHLGE